MLLKESLSFKYVHVRLPPLALFAHQSPHVVDYFIQLFNKVKLLHVSERRRVKHEGDAAGGTRDRDPTVALLLLQTTDQHTGAQFMGEKVRPAMTNATLCHLLTI